MPRTAPNRCPSIVKKFGCPQHNWKAPTQGAVNNAFELPTRFRSVAAKLTPSPHDRRYLYENN
ncbi:hypothetical protein GCM10011297_17640 [Bacterioplanes sanyensis]|nr:hypothetical protein GCM10011297_17640 [Bacterioplanes sanyensis]